MGKCFPSSLVRNYFFSWWCRKTFFLASALLYMLPTIFLWYLQQFPSSDLILFHLQRSISGPSYWKMVCKACYTVMNKLIYIQYTAGYKSHWCTVPNICPKTPSPRKGNLHQDNATSEIFNYQVSLILRKFIF